MGRALQILQAIASVVLKKDRAAGRRSPRWGTVRKKHLLTQPACAACGSTKSLEAHHLVPVQVDKSRELDPENLITLCGGKRNCHLVVGHGWDWSKYRPDAKDLAARMLTSQIVDPAHEQ